MAITVSMAIAAITDIKAITASTDIRGNCSQYNYTTTNREMYVIITIKSI